MNRKVLGKNILVSVYITDGFYPVFCAKTAELEMNQDEIEITTVNSGSSREYETGIDNSTLNITGVTTLNNDDGRISVIYLWQNRKTKKTFQFLMTDQDGNQRAIQFDAIITKLNLSKDVTSWSQSGVDLRITGSINFDATISPPVSGFDLLADSWTGGSGHDYIDGASNEESYTLVSTDTPIFVSVDGTEFDLVSGIPANRQAQFVTSPSVKIQFPADLIFTGVEKIWVIFKRPV